MVISARLVEAMGGSIEVESEPGRGSNFHFAVPVGTDERTEPGQQLATPTFAGLHALVVDDNGNNRRILQRQLEVWGATSDAASQGAEALRLADTSGGYDLAIIDLHMPGMDGVDLAIALHAIPEYAGLPLVLLSSTSVAQDRLDDAQFAARLVKPTKSAQLLDTLARALGLAVPTPRRMPAAPPVAFSALRVLVVEDNAVNQKLAMLFLQRLGYRADVAGNGVEAVAAVTRTPYDVVLMDVQMPEMDGLEATRRIRAILPADRQPTIIAMTANAMPEDRRMCLAAGMDHYLAKPIRLQELADTLAASEPAGAPQARPVRSSGPANPSGKHRSGRVERRR